MITVKTKQSFKKSVLSGEDEIKVEDPQLAKWLVVIHGIKQAAWAIAIVFVGAGIYTALASGGAAAPGAVGIVALSSGAVGMGGAAAMIGLGLALGGIAGLQTVRNKYTISDKGQGFVVLKKKKR